MKNRFFLTIIFAAVLAAPVLAETLVLDDEEERPAPVQATAVTVKPAATPVKTVQPKNTATALPAAPATAPTAKPAATAVVQQPQSEELKAKMDYIKSSLESALAANNDLAANLREMQTDIRRIEERSLEIKGMSQDMTDLKDRLKSLEDRYSKDKDVMNKAIGEMDKMRDDLKSSVDRVEGWSDIMDVLKKGISNNELEMAKMKKTMNDLKLKYGDTDESVLTGMLKWPYTGFVALLLSIIALSVAVAK